jgi:inosine/guanosine/xanthosine phosphorylase family protein
MVVLADHINFTGASPLKGPAFGTRFPDLTHAYDRQLRAVLHAAGVSLGLDLHSGVLAAMPGPAYETPAEVRMLRILGADVVGMSTVPAVLAAVECGLPVAAVSVVSNLAAGLADEPLLHADVTVAARAAATRLADLFSEACRHFATQS